MKQANGCPTFLSEPFQIKFLYNQTISGREASHGIFTLRRGRDLILQRNGTFEGSPIEQVEWQVDPATFNTTTSESSATARIQIVEFDRSGVLYTSQYTVSSFLFPNSTSTATIAPTKTTVIIGPSASPTQSASAIGLSVGLYFLAFLL